MMNDNEKNTIFIYYVFGEYTKYIPYCIYGILKNYPQSFVKIFVNKKLNEKEKKSLNWLNNQNFEIKENYFNNIEFDKRCKIKGGNGKILRWLIPYKELDGFKYSYIGDIDMLICKENASLIDAHIDHLNKTNLPFSNKVRKGQNRLTGLHFIDIEKYYNKINFFIDKCLSDIDYLNYLISQFNGNENFLYYFVKKYINFNEGDISDGGKFCYRPHHGTHLGLLRLNKPNFEKIEKIPTYLHDKDFLKIHENLNIKEINLLQKFENQIKKNISNNSNKTNI